jgi:hypothetical protein
MDFTAYYLVALPPQTTDPSKSGFETRESAFQYILNHHCCDDCRKLEESGEFSACLCEWVVVETEILD